MTTPPTSRSMANESPLLLPPPLRRTLVALARVVCPPELETLALVEPVIDHFATNAGAMPLHIRVGLLAGLTSFELGAALQPRTAGRPFSRLDAAQAERYFLSWTHAPVGAMRQLAKALKGLLVLGYCEQPVVRERIGLDPDGWIAKVARERLARWGEEIERAEIAVTAPDVPIATLRATRATNAAVAR